MLQPPVKWSYLKLIGWLVLGSLTALVVYAQWVISSSTKSSLSLRKTPFASNEVSRFLACPGSELVRREPCSNPDALRPQQVECRRFYAADHHEHHD